MILSTLFSFLPYAMITAYTPGPNNILAFNTISMYGWKKGMSTIIGIAAGFFCVMLLCAFTCFRISQLMPSIMNFMKYVGAAYILWIAYHVWNSSMDPSVQNNKFSFLRGFVMQFINVKIILYAITIYTAYIIPANNSFQFLLLFAVIISIVGVSGCIVWGVAGSILQKFIFKHTKHTKVFNIVMSILLIQCALQLIIK